MSAVTEPVPWTAPSGAAALHAGLGSRAELLGRAFALGADAFALVLDGSPEDLWRRGAGALWSLDPGAGALPLRCSFGAAVLVDPEADAVAALVLAEDRMADQRNRAPRSPSATASSSSRSCGPSSRRPPSTRSTSPSSPPASRRGSGSTRSTAPSSVAPPSSTTSARSRSTGDRREARAARRRRAGADAPAHDHRRRAGGRDARLRRRRRQPVPQGVGRLHRQHGPRRRVAARRAARRHVLLGGLGVDALRALPPRRCVPRLRRRDRLGAAVGQADRRTSRRSTRPTRGAWRTRSSCRSATPTAPCSASSTSAPRRAGSARPTRTSRCSRSSCVTPPAQCSARRTRRTTPRTVAGSRSCCGCRRS